MTPDPPAPQRNPRQRLLPTDNFRSPAALSCFLGVAAVGLVLDLWTKFLAWERLVIDVGEGRDGRPQVIPDRVEVIPYLLDFTAVANYGAAMGMGQGLRAVFLAVSAFAVVVLTGFFANSGNRRLYQVTLGLLLGGVIGNLYDRLVWGYVRDMIHIFPGVQWADLWSVLPAVDIFPWVFNLADVYLCVGVAVVMLYVLLSPAEPEPPASAEPAGE